jgi:D-lactate dehydrogenase
MSEVSILRNKMKIAFFDTHKFEREAFDLKNQRGLHQMVYLDCRLTAETAELSKGCQVVCSFVNDHLDAKTLAKLKRAGIQLIALRSAGFNHVDLTAAKELALPVARVPEYSPHAVAEHAVALILSLNRNIHRAYTRVRELNFSLEGLVGFDMLGKTVGIIGVGRIGRVLVQILNGFGCKVLAYDLVRDESLVKSGVLNYASLDEIYRQADIISLNVPLTEKTRHMIDATAIEKMKKKVLIINTGRGGLIETRALIDALNAHRIGGAGLDVYEEEEAIFFQDRSVEGISDDLFARLLMFPNVIVTSHQAFLTSEALRNIAQTTLENISSFEKTGAPNNQVLPVSP